MSTDIEGSNLFWPSNVYVGVCHLGLAPYVLGTTMCPKQSCRIYINTSILGWFHWRKVWELTRDMVGATAELSAVVEENGHPHPCSVEAYFAVVCAFRGMVFLHDFESMHDSGLSSWMEMMSSFTCFSFSSVSSVFSSSRVHLQPTHDHDNDFSYFGSRESTHRHSVSSSHVPFVRLELRWARPTRPKFNPLRRSGTRETLEGGGLWGAVLRRDSATDRRHWRHGPCRRTWSDSAGSFGLVGQEATRRRRRVQTTRRRTRRTTRWRKPRMKRTACRTEWKERLPP